jgi:pyruvate/2-oxoglutarate dehydrogenase complex dihydrolipoamide dehydrogenase (E3) component
LASTGLYGKDLDEKGIAYRVIEKHFKENDRAICDDNTKGFVRFRIDAKKDTILGASIVGEVRFAAFRLSQNLCFTRLSLNSVSL